MTNGDRINPIRCRQPCDTSKRLSRLIRSNLTPCHGPPLRRVMIPLATAVLLLAGTTTDLVSDPFIGDSRRMAHQAMTSMAQRPVAQAMVDQALHWLGRPYNAGSLDRQPRENLRIDLTTFDCLLLVEQLLALAHSRGSDALIEQVRLLRYDGGEVSFCRRHHYFSRWAAAAAARGLVSDITPGLPGAVTRERPLRFMGRHPDLYGPMAKAENRACILRSERGLQVRQAYVPLERLRAATPWLRSGDIFALVTAVPDLDVTHTGLLERRQGRMDALHAAPGRGVMRSPDLVRYAAAVPDVIGVSVLRPIDR